MSTGRQRAGFRVVRDLCGHGVGRNIHERPNVPNTFDRHNTELLHEGLVITIEPFLTTRATAVYEAEDGCVCKVEIGPPRLQTSHKRFISSASSLACLSASF